MIYNFKNDTLFFNRYLGCFRSKFVELWLFYWGVLLPNFFKKKKRQYPKKALPQLKRETYVYGQMIANNNEKINWRFKHWTPQILPIFSPKETPQYLRQFCPIMVTKPVKCRAFFLVLPFITFYRSFLVVKKSVLTCSCVLPLFVIFTSVRRLILCSFSEQGTPSLQWFLRWFSP